MPCPNVKNWILPAAALILFGGFAPNGGAALPSDQYSVQFAEPATNSSNVEVQHRLGYTAPATKYKIANESFRTIVPASYSTNEAWGLFVWISPGNDAWIPADWMAELEAHRLLFVGANKTGNNRAPVDRARLALDATANMLRQYTIDCRRVYIAGFSGGARMASILGVSYPEIFAGALCVCGVDFYQYVPTASGGYYTITYVPNARPLAVAKQSSRFVLLTGESDMNRQNTKDVLEKGFQYNRFRNVLYLEVPGMAHAIPSAAYLSHALDFLIETNQSKGIPLPRH